MYIYILYGEIKNNIENSMEVEWVLACLCSLFHLLTHIEFNLFYFIYLALFRGNGFKEDRVAILSFLNYLLDRIGYLMIE